MKTVFVDAVFWIALHRPRDQWRKSAETARKEVADARLMTTDGVLLEFLAALSGGGETLRKTAASMVRFLLGNVNVDVIPQTHQAFLDGLNHYEKRLDKGYNLVDCVSMNTMRVYGIADILTNDRHFEQEGFNILMKDQ